MSFSLTKKQMRERTKTVTRRLGWANLKPGERVLAVEKCMGLKKGEKQKKIAIIQCVSNRPEKLKFISQSECNLEGFPELTPVDFINMFWRRMRCHPNRNVNRIEFRFIEEA